MCIAGKGSCPRHQESAEWPLGLAWLSICYAKLAEHGRDFDQAHKPVHFDWTQRRNYFHKAVHYFQQLEKSMTPGGLRAGNVSGEPGRAITRRWPGRRVFTSFPARC